MYQDGWNPDLPISAIVTSNTCKASWEFRRYESVGIAGGFPLLRHRQFLPHSLLKGTFHGRMVFGEFMTPRLLSHPLLALVCIAVMLIGISRHSTSRLAASMDEGSADAANPRSPQSPLNSPLSPPKPPGQRQQTSPETSRQLRQSSPGIPRPHDALKTLQQATYQPMSLQEAIYIALLDSTVLRDLGGRILDQSQAQRSRFQVTLQDSDPRSGMQSAQSEFDATLSAQTIFEKNNRPVNNVFLGGGTRSLLQDYHDYQLQLTKPTAAGTQFSIRTTADFDSSNAPGNASTSVWQTQLEAEIRQPLLRGAGTNVNRVIGRRDHLDFPNGIEVARIRSEMSQADFEIGLRNFVSDVVNAYWDLYYAWRIFDNHLVARNQALEHWTQATEQEFDKEKTLPLLIEFHRLDAELQNALSGRQQEGTRSQNGSQGGSFRGITGLYLAERRFRHIIGLPVTGDTLVCPTDEPSQSPVVMDDEHWDAAVSEAIQRRPEIKRERLQTRKLSLIAAASRNYLLPTLDFVGKQRLRGMGELPDATGNMLAADHPEWNLGMEFSLPVGFRHARGAVNNAELQIARQKVVIHEQEQQIILDLSNAVSDMQRAYQVMLASSSQMNAAAELVQAVQDAQPNTPSLQAWLPKIQNAQSQLLQARNRHTLAQVEYALAVKNVHLEKGSLPDALSVMVADEAQREDFKMPGVETVEERAAAIRTQLPDPRKELLRRQLAKLTNVSEQHFNDLIQALENGRLDSVHALVVALIPNSPDAAQSALSPAALLLRLQLFSAARHSVRTVVKQFPEKFPECERYLAHIDVVEGSSTKNTDLIRAGRDRYWQLFLSHPDDLQSASNCVWTTCFELQDTPGAAHRCDLICQKIPRENMPEFLLDAIAAVRQAHGGSPEPDDSLIIAPDNHENSVLLLLNQAENHCNSNDSNQALLLLQSALLDPGPALLLDSSIHRLNALSSLLCQKQWAPQTGLETARLCLKNNCTDAAQIWVANALRTPSAELAGPLHHTAADILLLAGIQNQNLTQLQDAAREYQLALELNPSPDWVAANNLLSLQTQQLNQPDKALETLSEILDRYPVDMIPPRLLATSCLTLRTNGRREQAVRLLELAVNQRPDSPELLLQLAIAHLDHQNLPAARNCYQRAAKLGLTDAQIQSLQIDGSLALLGTELSSDIPR